jgi:hypothetical protein
MCLKYSNLNFKKIIIFQICAGGQPGQTVCRGDSGSPLIRFDEKSGTRNPKSEILIRFDEKSGWIQEGIVSSGKYD